MRNHFIIFLFIVAGVHGPLLAQMVQVKTAADLPEKILTKARWQKISVSLDIGNTFLSASGTMKVDYKAAAEPEVKFTVAKNQKKCYYRLGDTETFNNEDAYVYIDHSSKRVVISHSKSVQINLFPAPEMIAQILEQQSDLIKETIVGKNIRIGFRNEKNADCKEYAMELDAVSFAPRSIFERLDDTRVGAEIGSEVSIRIRFAQWSAQQPAAGILDYSSMVVSTPAGWKLKGAVQNYHLTVL